MLPHPKPMVSWGCSSEESPHNRHFRSAGHAPTSVPPPKIGPGRYSAYRADPSDWGSLGSSITHHATLVDALKACALQAGCVGIKYSPTGGARPYMTFGGSLAEGVVGKVRTTGPSINPWARYK
jgi:hypothetical protein